MKQLSGKVGMNFHAIPDFFLFGLTFGPRFLLNSFQAPLLLHQPASHQIKATNLYGNH